MSILFINACVRDESRTLVLADNLIRRLGMESKEIRLADMDIKSLDKYDIVAREKFVNEGKLGENMLKHAVEFAAADCIVIAAPLWDLGFPAILKTYIENIMVSGITFEYDMGVPKGLCKATKLYYVTTSGGPFSPEYGYGYIKALSRQFWGIEETACIYAENLDVDMIPAERILTDSAICQIV